MSSTFTKRTPSAIWAGLGIVLILAGTAICLKAARAHGQDFSYLYVLGKLISRRQNPYHLPNAQETFLQHYGSIPNDGQARIYYPPSTGVALLPLAVLPYRVALMLWTGLLLFILPCAVWRLLRVIAPRLSIEYQLLVVGTVFASSSLRWGVQLLQPAPLVAALCALFIADVLTGKTRRAAVWSVLALSFKMTLALPFVGVWLVQRRFGTVCAVLAFWLLVMVAGFGLAGGSQAVADYRQSTATMETETREVNSPNPYLPQSLPRLDFAYITHWVQPESPLAKTGALLLTGASVLILAVLGIKAGRAGQTDAVVLLFFMAFSCLTLLAVYHHHYDVALMIPAFVTLLHPGMANVRRKLLLAGMPLLLYLVFYPQAQAQNALSRAFGMTGFALSKTLGAFFVVLFFGAVLLALARTVRRPLSSNAEGDALVQ